VRATAAMRCSVSSIACGPGCSSRPRAHAERLQLAHHVLRRVAVDRVAGLGERQADADGHRRVEGARRGERGLRLVERRHRLEEQQVDAGLEQTLDLLAVRRLRSSAVTCPIGARALPIGPTAPATSARPRAASRAILAPSRLILPTCASRPCGPSLKRWRRTCSSRSRRRRRRGTPRGSAGRGRGSRVQLVEAAVEEDAARVEHRAIAPSKTTVPAESRSRKGFTGAAAARSVIIGSLPVSRGR